MRIEIKSKNFTNGREYKGKTYGQQEAALFGRGDYPLAFMVNVEQGKEYEPGDYEIDSSSFGTDKFRELSLGRVKLVRIEAAPKGKA